MASRIGDLTISSPDIEPLSTMDERFTGYGDNVVPWIEVSGVPAGTVELALMLHDPDAPRPNGFTHWVVYGLPPEEGPIDVQADGVRLGPNGAGAAQYAGPHPPPGHGVHHYYFFVYALDTKVEGTPTREEFLRQYADHVIEQNRLVGTFSR